MSSRGTTMAIVIGVIVFACLCTLALTLTGLASFWLIGSRQVVTPPTPAFILPTPASTPSIAPAIGDPNAEMASIEKQVRDLRGWTAVKSVERQFMTPAELRDYEIEDFAKDYSREEAADDTRVLAAFGLLDPDFELYDFYIDLYSENILGFYDKDVGKLFIISDSGQLGAVERSTFSHEYEHALQDQLYGLDALGWNDAAIEQDAQKFAACRPWSRAMPSCSKASGRPGTSPNPTGISTMPTPTPIPTQPSFGPRLICKRIFTSPTCRGPTS